MSEIPQIPNSQVTITGGTGSFGQAMAQHLLSQGVRQINIFSRDEAKQDMMRRKLSDERLRFFLGDVRDYQSLEPAMQGSDYVFHAAALKQVPSCEFFPIQAVKTNILGSDNVLNAAARAGVTSLVCLSTDKAVYPICSMGMSKALMERTAQAWARNNPDSQMRVAITRYGNVLYSRGSVVPYFMSQIKAGKPVTLTDPNMTRFHMTLEQSVDLVKYAWTNGASGDLFVMKAPASKVSVLAEAVCDIMGEPDHRRVIIGARHSEKMHESLLSAEDLVKAIDMGNYFRVPLDARSLDYDLYFTEGTTREVPAEGFSSENARQLSKDEVAELLLTIPEIQEIVGR